MLAPQDSIPGQWEAYMYSNFINCELCNNIELGTYEKFGNSKRVFE